MQIITLICLLCVTFANHSFAALCDSVNATPAEEVFGKQSNLKAQDQPKKSKRALLVCSTSEECLSLANIPFCINTQTGNFHNADLTTGNAVTGNYVLADGREGNLYYGPFPTPQKSSTNSQATVTVTQGGMFVIPTATTKNSEEIESATATDVNEEDTDATTVTVSFPARATNTPRTSITDGSGTTTGGSGVTTDGVTVPGGAGRAELGLRMGIWIVVMMCGASMLGAFIL